MKSLLFFLLISTSFHTFSQVVRGKIVDDDGTGVSNATIRVKDTSYATTSNADGFYQLELKSGKYILIFSSFGYESLTDSIEINELDMELHVTLEKVTKETDEIVIEDISDLEKGKQIMKKVIDKRRYYQDLLKEYSCNTYCFSTLERNRMDSLITDSVVGKESLGILEWNARSYYNGPLNYKDEFDSYEDFKIERDIFIDASQPQGILSQVGTETIGQGVFEAPNRNFFISGIKDAHFSILDNTIDDPHLTKNPLISPLAFNALLFYKFYFEKSFYDSTQELIYEIKLEPRFKYEALFEGTLLIRDKSWEIVSYELNINPKLLLYHDELQIKCEYIKDGEHLIPIKKEFTFKIENGKRTKYGLIRIIHSDYKYSIEDKSAKFWAEAAVYKEDALDQDSSFLSKNRLFSLKENELKFIQEQDSLINYFESDEYKREEDSISNIFHWYDPLFFGYENTNSFKKQKYSIGGLISQIDLAGIGGYHHRLNPNYRKEFKNRKMVSFWTLVDYGFENKDLRGAFTGSIMNNRINFSTLKISFGNNYEIISTNQNVISIAAPSNRVIRQEFELTFSRELINGLYIRSIVNYSDVKSVDDLKSSDWVEIFGEFQTPLSFDRYKILLTTLQFEYKFKQKFKIKRNIKYTYNSIWPVLQFTYKKALPDIFDAEANFDFMELGVSDEIKLNSLGRFEFSFLFGAFLQKKDLRLCEYKYFSRSIPYYFSDPLNSFQLLDTSLNTSNNYFQLTYIHRFGGFFLNKIWLFNHLRLEEVVGGGFLLVPDAHFFHSELYLGIEKVFKIRREKYEIGVYAACQVNTTTGASFHLKYNFFF